MLLLGPYEVSHLLVGTSWCFEINQLDTRLLNKRFIYGVPREELLRLRGRSISLPKDVPSLRWDGLLAFENGKMLNVLGDSALIEQVNGLIAQKSGPLNSPETVTLSLLDFRTIIYAAMSDHPDASYYIQTHRELFSEYHRHVAPK